MSQRLIFFTCFFSALLVTTITVGGPMDPVIKPIGVSGSADTVSSFDPLGGLENLINGDTDGSMTHNGLVENGNSDPEVPIAVVTEEDALMFDHRNIFTNEDPGLAGWHWVTAARNGGDDSDFFDSDLNDDPITIDFDLGGLFEVTGMFVWRYNGGFGSIEQNNPKDWTIEFSTDGGANYGNSETIPALTNLGVGGNAVGGELLAFPSHEANAVRISITDNFNGEPGLAFGGDRVGLAELRFQGLAVEENSADYNSDGFVDTADYVLWRDTLGSTTDLRADGSGNDVVGPEDYIYWKDRFGSVAAASTGLAGTASIPEPACVLLVGNAIAAFMCARVRRTTRSDSNFPFHRVVGRAR